MMLEGIILQSGDASTSGSLEERKKDLLTVNGIYYQEYKQYRVSIMTSHGE